jgi:hypothetical protein
MRWRPSPRTTMLLKRSLLVLVVTYICCLGLIWWAMRQPPERFGRIMSRIPGPVAFLVFPFETLWTQARAGSLRAGDAAPDFSLMKQDKSGSIQLSALTMQRQPVVLVFGSYT